VDIAGVLPASHRAASLILEIAGGSVGDLGVGHGAEARGGFDPAAALHEIDEPVFTHSVTLRPERVTAVLGKEVPEERVHDILTAFGLLKTDSGWEIPSFRPDLTREIDLIEEIARVVGIDAVPARMRAQFAPASATDLAYDRAMNLRRALTAQGFAEARTLILIGEATPVLDTLYGNPENRRKVKNPMNDDQVLLRPGLVPGLLQALRDNMRAGAKTVRLFEIGRVFSAQTPEESTRLAVVLTGPTSERSWRSGEGGAADFYHLKGVISAALGPQTTFSMSQSPGLALAVIVEVDGKPVGFAGQLWPKDARALDTETPVLVAEIDPNALPAGIATKKYREIPRFPATARDIALLAPLTLANEQIEQTLKSANEPLLAGVELFDVFADPTGARIPADKKSLAYSLTYRSTEKTLTADEVNAAHTRLKERLKSALAVTLRE
jgi:phenylalanyl-tRNA synthetase beta chain